MKIEISKRQNPVAQLFAQPASVVAEVEAHKVAIADELAALMQQNGVSKAELARRLKIQPSRVTSMLSGTSNFTIETMVRAARAVGGAYHQTLLPAEKKVRWQAWQDSEVHPDLLATTRTMPKANTTFSLSLINIEDDRTAA